MTTRCYRAEGVWIPGCWARVNSDHDCDCPPKGQHPIEQTERIAALEERVADLEAYLSAQSRTEGEPTP
jgi:hypothetical protein